MADESDHHTLSEHNGLKLPLDGQSQIVLADNSIHDWGDDFNYNFELLDERSIVPMTSTARSALTPSTPTWVYETDNESLYYHNGTSWTLVAGGGAGGASVSDDGTEVLATPSDLNFGADIDVTDDGDNTATVTLGVNVLTTADEGSGNGIDADTVDAYEAAALAVLSENETITGTWTFNANQRFGDDDYLLFGDNDEFGIYMDGPQQELRVAVDPLGTTPTDALKIQPNGVLNALVGLTESGLSVLNTDSLTTGQTISGAWNFTGEMTRDSEEVLAAKQSPNLHLPGTKLEASGGNDRATQSIYVPAGKTFHLWGWGARDETGASPAAVDLYVRSGDLTGSPTTEYSDTSASGWEEGTTGNALTTVAGAKTIHIQMINVLTTDVDNVSMMASYSILDT